MTDDHVIRVMRETDPGESADDRYRKPVPTDPPKSFLPSKGVGRNSETPGLPFAMLSTKLDNVPDDPPWVWDGYLAPGAITLLAGRPKVGKSTLGFGLIAALAQGQTFLDRQTNAKGVLLLSEEREGTLAEKARRWGLDGSIHLLMRHEAHGFPWPAIVAQAVAYCHAHKLGVLVVDTFDKWTGLKGDAENNAGSVLEALEPLMKAAGAGLAVLVVSHQRKSPGDYGEAVRGSNALTGGVDVVAELERPSSALDGQGVRVLNAVSRYASTPEGLVLALTDDGYEARGDTFEARADTERAKVLETIETLGGATAKRLAEDTGLARTTVQRHVDKLLADGTINRSGEGVKGRPFVFLPKVPTLSGQNEFSGVDDGPY